MDREKKRSILLAIKSINVSTATKEDKEKAVAYLRTILEQGEGQGRYFNTYASDLCGAFSWSETPLGAEFWGRMDDIVGKLNGKPKIKAGSYHVDVEKQGILVGCQTITWEQWKALKKAVKKSGYLKK